MPRWNLDDLSWAQFEPAQVDPDLLRVVKAAALVEYNGGHYARYLRSVFREDESFCALTYGWAEEEVQHGLGVGPNWRTRTFPWQKRRRPSRWPSRFPPI